MNTNIKKISTELITSFTKICREVYYDPKSIFYNPKYNLDNDYFIKILRYYHISDLDKINIPKPDDEKNNKIYNVLAVYLILLIEVTREKFFLELLVKFVFLLREYLNIRGWDHFSYLKEFGLIKNLNIKGEFCVNNTCEEIPELINEFVSVFLEIDPRFSANIKDLTDLTQNFCYWLFINGFSNYKLCKYDNNNNCPEQ